MLDTLRFTRVNVVQTVGRLSQVPRILPASGWPISVERVDLPIKILGRRSGLYRPSLAISNIGRILILASPSPRGSNVAVLEAR